MNEVNCLHYNLFSSSFLSHFNENKESNDMNQKIIQNLVLQNLLSSHIIIPNNLNQNTPSPSLSLSPNMCLSDNNITFLDVLNSYAEVYHFLGEEEKALSYLNESMVICSIHSPNLLYQPGSPKKKKQFQKTKIKTLPQVPTSHPQTTINEKNKSSSDSISSQELTNSNLIYQSNIEDTDILLAHLESHLQLNEQLLQFRIKYGNKILHYMSKIESESNFHVYHTSYKEKIEAAQYLLNCINTNSLNSMGFIKDSSQYNNYKGQLIDGVLGDIFEEIIFASKQYN